MPPEVFDTPEPIVLSIVIPCYNEEKTLEACVDKVLQIADEKLLLELIIVDDFSTDESFAVATRLKHLHPEIQVLRHEKNRGKGAALRTGFKAATGDFVAVQDADLEYDPEDLKRLLRPLVSGRADVVLGSRFLSRGEHRVLYYWHSLGNRFLTFLSNMFTDLNLTDMECCYKVFSREVIQSVEIEEDRFGFEPEIVAKIAQMRLRIFEMGVSYFGRTYEEGKKITAKDGVRALYCIMRYNGHRAPLPIQFVIYFLIGAFAALCNFIIFYVLLNSGASIASAALIAFYGAALINYLLCIAVLFRHGARWNSTGEIAIYLLIVSLIGLLDLGLTKLFVMNDILAWKAKLLATMIVFVVNFLARRFLVFPEPTAGPWKPQHATHGTPPRQPTK